VITVINAVLERILFAVVLM